MYGKYLVFIFCVHQEVLINKVVCQNENKNWISGEAWQRQSIPECASRAEVSGQKPNEGTCQRQHALHGARHSRAQRGRAWSGKLKPKNQK